MIKENQRWQLFDYLKVLPAIFMAIIIFYLSSLTNPYPTTPSRFTLLILNPILHICEFGSLSFLLLFGLYPKVKAIVIIFFAFLYAFLDELHQLFVPYRYFDVKDILFDFSGIFLGYLIYIIYGLVSEKLSKKPHKL